MFVSEAQRAKAHEPMERILLPIVKLRTVLLSWKAFSAMAVTG
jgi:hypothetical protein